MAKRKQDGLSLLATASRVWRWNCNTPERWSKRIKPRSCRRKSRKKNPARLRTDVYDDPDMHQYEHDERVTRFGVAQRKSGKDYSF